MIEGGSSFSQAARLCRVSPRTASKRYRRFKAEGLEGLQDRASRPDRLRSVTPEETCDRIIALRRQRLTGADNRRLNRRLTRHGQPIGLKVILGNRADQRA